MTRRGASIVFKTCIFILGLTGILIQMGVFWGEFNTSMFNYYTLQSNALCTVFMFLYIIALVKTSEENKLLSFLQKISGSIVICITVTMVIFHLFLAGSFMMHANDANTSLIPQEFKTAASNILHYVLPICVILDYLIFAKKGTFTKSSPFVWTIIPFAYLFFAMIRAQFGDGIGQNSRYPYPFLDIDALGLPAVLVTIVILAVAFIVFGYLLYSLDRYWASKTSKKI